MCSRGAIRLTALYYKTWIGFMRDEDDDKCSFLKRIDYMILCASIYSAVSVPRCRVSFMNMDSIGRALHIQREACFVP